MKMAKQDANPGPFPGGDGCTGVMDWLPFVGDMSNCCDEHDEAFWFGGGEVEYKAANKAFYKCIHKKRRCWFCHQVSKVVAYWRRGGIRHLGGRSAFNWLGPGPLQSSSK